MKRKAIEVNILRKRRIAKRSIRLVSDALWPRWSIDVYSPAVADRVEGALTCAVQQWLIGWSIDVNSPTVADRVDVLQPGSLYAENYWVACRWRMAGRAASCC
jgi:hypothetical protein